MEAFPIGYRHLAYLQTRIGYKVKEDMPGLDGPEVDALYAFGDEWLRGKQQRGEHRTIRRQTLRHSGAPRQRRARNDELDRGVRP